MDQEGQPVALRRQSAKPDRKVGAVLDNELTHPWSGVDPGCKCQLHSSTGGLRRKDHGPKTHKKTPCLTVLPGFWS